MKKMVLGIMTLSLFLYSCRHETPGETKDFSSWGYQLQQADVDQVASAGFPLVVIDYSRDGDEETRYTTEEIAHIKAAGVLPICYISIGEAEDYRFYWQESWYRHPPSWLGPENPDWEGNYPVKYWDPGWKAIVWTYLDKILAQGFTGVYLDRVDAFEFWSDPEEKKDITLPRSEAAQLMMQFVAEIAQYCRSRADQTFRVIPQNGESILEFDSDGAYLSTISAIGVEDLFYDELTLLPEAETASRLLFLQRFTAVGKNVFSIDYVDDDHGYSGTNKNRIDDYYSRCRAQGFIPYAALHDRELDELNIIPGVQPPPE